MNMKQRRPIWSGAALFDHDILFSQGFPGFLEEGLVEQDPGGKNLAAIRHDHFHLGIAGEHAEHQLHMADGGMVQAGEFQIQHLALLRRAALPVRRDIRPGKGIRRIAHDLGCLLVPDGQAPLHHHRLVLL